VRTGLELFGCYLLLEAGDFGLRVEFMKVASERGDLNVVLVAGLLGFDLGAKGVGSGLLGNGVACEIEERKLIWRPKLTLFGVKFL
jgi:hypothetical protein